MAVAASRRLGCTPRGNLLPVDGFVTYRPGFFAPDEADKLFASLCAILGWRRESVRLYGREVALPRLTAWYGPVDYSYSGLVHPAAELPTVVGALVDALAPVAPGMDSVLANLYRSGDDCVGFHCDDEAIFGEEPLIASLSFGATRRFVLKHRRTQQRVEVLLESGSLLVMGGATQRHWMHAVPRTKRPVGARLNLTYRRCVLGACP